MGSKKRRRQISSAHKAPPEPGGVDGPVRLVTSTSEEEDKASTATTTVDTGEQADGEGSNWTESNSLEIGLQLLQDLGELSSVESSSSSDGEDLSLFGSSGMGFETVTLLDGGFGGGTEAVYGEEDDEGFNREFPK